MSHVFDIKQWISPHLEEIHHHTHPHIFSFRLNTNGKAEMRYKKWSHMDWEKPIIILKSLPDGAPPLVLCSMVKIDIDHLRKDIPKYAAAGMISEEDVLWWNNELATFDERFNITDKDPVFPLHSLISLREQGAGGATAHSSPATPTTVPSTIPANIAGLHHSHSAPTEKIVIGKLQRKKRKRGSSETELPPAKSQKQGISQQPGELPQGEIVALQVLKYKDFLPHLAVVQASTTSSSITVDWLDGTYLDTWQPWKVRRRIIRETFPMEAVLRHKCALTEAKRLSPSLVAELKTLYETATFI